jgi:hypothetical protein
MQYGRRQNQGEQVPAPGQDKTPLVDDTKGWVCSDAAEHFVQGQ